MPNERPGTASFCPSIGRQGGEKGIKTMKRIILVFLAAAMSVLVGACTIPGVGDYQRALEFGCTTSDAGLVCSREMTWSDL